MHKRFDRPPGAPRCKCKTEVYSRVVGYYRPVEQWNKGKKAEFVDRVVFDATGERDKKGEK